MIVRAKIIRLKFIFINLIILLIAIPAAANEPNSEDDPFTQEKEERNSAELPVPWGIILSADYLMLFNRAGDKSVDEMSRIPFELSYYIDSWQFSFNSKEYGNTARVLFRTTGRDEHYGFFLESGYGWEIKDGDPENDNDKFMKENPLLIGLGSKSLLTVDLKEVSLSFYMDIVLGYGTMKDTDSYVYFQMDLLYGTRIPISTMSLYLQAGGFWGYGNYVKSRTKEVGWNEKTVLYDLKSGLYGGVIIKAVYAFNFNL